MPASCGFLRHCTSDGGCDSDGSGKRSGQRQVNTRREERVDEGLDGNVLSILFVEDLRGEPTSCVPNYPIVVTGIIASRIAEITRRLDRRFSVPHLQLSSTEQLDKPWSPLELVEIELSGLHLVVVYDILLPLF